MPLPTITVLALILTGIGASFIGSIVGLGGGFIAVPVLRLGFHLAPGVVAASSLVLVFANSASAGTYYALQGRVAWKIVLWVALAAIPGSVLGAYLSARVSGPVFDILYALFLTAVAIDVIRSAARKNGARSGVARGERPTRWLLIPAGLVVGFVSSLFGIGGGVIVIPFLLYATNEEMHTVAATSTAIIALTVPVGIVTQLLQGDVLLFPALALGAGGLIGGQAGAVFSTRISSKQLSLVLAIALVAAAAGMALRHLF